MAGGWIQNNGTFGEWHGLIATPVAGLSAGNFLTTLAQEGSLQLHWLSDEVGLLLLPS